MSKTISVPSDIGIVEVVCIKKDLPPPEREKIISLLKKFDGVCKEAKQEKNSFSLKFSISPEKLGEFSKKLEEIIQPVQT